jgi:hypothetical protein
MKNNIRLWIFVLFISISNISISGTIDPNAKDADYIQYGNAHDCVVLLRGLTEDKLLYRASAVIIDPIWILTAAHIVDEHTDHHIIYKDNTILIDKIILQPDFDAKKFGRKDLAICRLSKSVNLDFYPPLYDGADEVGKISSLAGYGDTGNFTVGANIADGLKRAGSNIIEKIEDDLLICSVLNRPSTQMEFLIARGDSGGGLFINQKLAGIHSGIWNYNGSRPESTYSTYSGHTRIANFRVWILNTIKNNSTKP